MPKNEIMNKNLNVQIKLYNVFGWLVDEFEELVDYSNYLFKSDFTFLTK